MSTAITSAVRSVPKVIILGSSSVQYCFSPDGCYGSMLADLLQRKCDVINRGYSGYNIVWCKHMLPKIINNDIAKDVAAFTVFLGANDSNSKEINPRQHVPLTKYRQSLIDVVNYLKDAGIQREKIILIAPPPCYFEDWAKALAARDPPVECGKDEKLTVQYAEACMSAAKECGTQSIDLYNEMLKHDNWRGFLIDGLHLSEKGSTFVFEQLKPIIEKLTSDIPIQFPEWFEVDYENPAATFSAE